MTTWVLLRGWAREARHWGDFPAALGAALPGGDCVVAIDLPGNGARHAEPSALHPGAMAAAVRAELRRRALPGPYAVLALSLGGMVAVQWASEQPRELAACVLVNSSGAGLSPFWQRLRPAAYPRLLGLLRPLGRLERERAILALTSNHRAGDAALAQQWAQWAQQYPVARANALRQLVAAARFRVPATAPAVPLLLLAAAADRLVDAECSRRLARCWHAPLRLHPTAGHDLPLDAGPWVAQQVSTWWREIRMPPAGR